MLAVAYIRLLSQDTDFWNGEMSTMPETIYAIRIVSFKVKFSCSNRLADRKFLLRINAYGKTCVRTSVCAFCFGDNALSNGHLRVDWKNLLNNFNDSTTSITFSIRSLLQNEYSKFFWNFTEQSIDKSKKNTFKSFSWIQSINVNNNCMEWKWMVEWIELKWCPNGIHYWAWFIVLIHNFYEND